MSLQAAAFRDVVCADDEAARRAGLLRHGSGDRFNCGFPLPPLISIGRARPEAGSQMGADLRRTLSAEDLLDRTSDDLLPRLPIERMPG